MKVLAQKRVDLAQVNCKLPLDLWRRVKIAAVEQETTMSQIIAQALADALRTAPR